MFFCCSFRSSRFEEEFVSFGSRPIPSNHSTGRTRHHCRPCGVSTRSSHIFVSSLGTNPNQADIHDTSFISPILLDLFLLTLDLSHSFRPPNPAADRNHHRRAHSCEAVFGAERDLGIEGFPAGSRQVRGNKFSQKQIQHFPHAEGHPPASDCSYPIPPASVKFPGHSIEAALGRGTGRESGASG